MSDLISRQAALDIYDDYNIDVENGELEAYGKHRKRILELPSARPRWTTDVNDILAYLDDVVHPLASPENWNVYSELHDMISDLLKHGKGEKS